MKRLLFLLGACAAAVSAAGLETAKTVYVLSMSRGIDQFLVNRLTNQHVFQVVTDPKLADIIFTDHLGEGFQAQLESISPSPDADEEEKPDAKTKPKADAKADADAAPASAAGMFSAPVNKLANPALNSNFGRNKGTYFLVDAKSREVLWSTFDPPKAYSNKELDRIASDIVARLKKDLNRK